MGIFGPSQYELQCLYNNGVRDGTRAMMDMLMSLNKTCHDVPNADPRILRVLDALVRDMVNAENKINRSLLI